MFFFISLFHRCFVSQASFYTLYMQSWMSFDCACIDCIYGARKNVHTYNNNKIHIYTSLSIDRHTSEWAHSCWDCVWYAKKNNNIELLIAIDYTKKVSCRFTSNRPTNQLKRHTRTHWLLCIACRLNMGCCLAFFCFFQALSRSFFGRHFPLSQCLSVSLTSVVSYKSWRLEEREIAREIAWESMKYRQMTCLLCHLLFLCHAMCMCILITFNQPRTAPHHTFLYEMCMKRTIKISKQTNETKKKNLNVQFKPEIGSNHDSNSNHLCAQTAQVIFFFVVVVTKSHRKDNLQCMQCSLSHILTVVMHLGDHHDSWFMSLS